MKHVPVTKAQLTHIYEIHIHFLLFFFFLVLHLCHFKELYCFKQMVRIEREGGYLLGNDGG